MDVNGKNFTRFLKRQQLYEKQHDSKALEKQHSKGKLTAWERIEILFDEDTFEEVDAFVSPDKSDTGFGKVQQAYGDGVIIGHGLILGRLTFAYAQDFTVMGGSLGSVHAAKIMKIQDMALKMGAPMIGLIDSGGARIQEGVASLAGYAGIFYRNVQSSGVIPQISVILVPAAGYTFAWTGLIPGATNNIGGVIQTGRDEFAHSDHYEIRKADDMRVVSADLGIHMTAFTA